MDDGQHLRKITKGAAIVLVGMFIGRFFGYMTRVVMARYFGPDAYGMFSIAATVLSIATFICLLGVYTSFPRLIPFYSGKNDNGRVRGVITSSVKMTIPLSIIAGIIVFLLSDYIAVQFFHNPALTPLIQVFGIITPLSVLLFIIIEAFKGFQSMKYKVVVEDFGKPILIFSLLFLFFFLGFDIMGVVYAYVIGYIFACIIGVYLILKLLPSGKSTSMSGEILSFSWPLIISGYLWMVYSSADVMILGIFRTTTEVGLYSASITAAAVMLVVMDSFIFIFTPVISELFAKGKKEEIRSAHKSVVKWIFMINLSFFLLMVLFSNSIMNIMFGSEYMAASTALIILATGYFLSTPGCLATSGLIAVGKTKIILAVTVVGASLNLAINLLLIPSMGIIGAAIAGAVSVVVMSYMRLIFARKYLGFNIFDWGYVKAAVSGVISVAVFYFLIKAFFLNPPWWVLVGAFPIFLGMYALIFVMLRGLDSNDVMILKSLESKTGIELGFVKRFIKRFL